jgi:hypothetical protein
LYLSKLASNPQNCVKFCETLHAMTFPPARLPWIPVVKSDRTITQLEWGQISDELSCVLLQRYAASLKQRMNSATIANYLPKR